MAIILYSIFLIIEMIMMIKTTQIKTFDLVALVFIQIVQLETAIYGLQYLQELTGETLATISVPFVISVLFIKMIFILIKKEKNNVGER